jgi:hypothetical protein
MRRPVLGRATPRPAAVKAKEAAAVPTPLGLEAGAELGQADIDGRRISYVHASRTTIWCKALTTGEDLGVIRWGEGCTPQLQIIPTDDLAKKPEGIVAEQVVRFGMALWRAAFQSAPLPSHAPVYPNPVVVGAVSSSV